MAKVIYFHGLGGGHESLIDMFGYISDIEIIQNPTSYYEEWEKDKGREYFQSLIKIEADIVVGTSFGGYVAYHYAKAKGLPVYLVNPALDRSLSTTGIGWMDFKYRFKKSQTTIFLGERDRVVPNRFTIDYLNDKEPSAKFYSFKHMEHSLSMFEWLQIWRLIKNEARNKKG